MSNIYNPEHAGAGSAYSVPHVPWHLGISPGEKAARIVDDHLAGEWVAGSEGNVDTGYADPEIRTAAGSQTESAIQRLLTIYGEDEARDHFSAPGLTEPGPRDRLDIALIDQIPEASARDEAPTVSELAPVPAVRDKTIMSADEFLLF